MMRTSLEVHSKLGTKLAKMRRYSVDFVDRQRFPTFDSDGFSMLWFDSDEDVVAA